MKLSRLLSASALAGTLACLPAAAWAQTTTTTQDPAAQEDEVIIVTGSRISRPTGLDSTTPIASITADSLTDTGELSLGDELNRLPALRSTVAQANSTNAIGTAGLNQLDLRGLGTVRTLVLVNGRRHVTASPGAYVVDVNTIPTALLERVDIVTGGTSAVYGSDAIAGVVNFITKRDYEGFDVRIQGGISDRGDRDSFTVSGIWGRNFADDRLNVAVSFEYAHQDQLLFEDRNDQTGAFTGTPGFFATEFSANEGLPVSQGGLGLPSASDGIPDTRFYGSRPGSVFGNISLGGWVSTSCPAAVPGDALNAARRQAVCTGENGILANGGVGAALADGYCFQANGQLIRDDPAIDNRSFGGGRFGGCTASGAEGAMLLPGLERINTNVLLNFDVSSAFQPFFEGKYVHVTANQQSTQPTFANGSPLTATYFLDNPFLTPGAVQTLRTILGLPSTNTTAGFVMQRFNNDIGTRAEDHIRETWRFVGGARGDLSSNLRYEVAFNYGRTDTFYETGGNVDIVKFNAAANAVRDGSGNIVCRVNADANPANDMPGCVPINLFGQGNSSQAARDYVLYKSSRTQWAEEVNAVAYLSGDTGSFFKLPGGAVGFSIGGEFRREDAFSDYDDFTQAGNTFLNSIALFSPPAVETWEAFGEVRIPILRDVPFFHELTLEGAARFSKYSSMDEGVWAYNFGGIWAPIRDIRFRAGYARSVRAPNLSDLYATPSQTFANALTDPCSSSQIGANPNRVRNCAAAGVPTTMTYTRDDNVTVTVPWENTLGSGLSGINRGNAGLLPEIGKSLTVGAVFEPSFIPGLSLTVDYYDIEVANVIASLAGQTVINQCYDDPVSINNPFCSLVFRRSGTGNALQDYTFAGQSSRRFAGRNADISQPVLGAGFIAQPFNYAKLTTSGIDADLSYRRKLGSDWTVGGRVLLSWLESRLQYTFITAPTQSTRIHGTLGDPEWQAAFSVDVAWKNIDFGYDGRYVGSMQVAAWETQNSWQGRPPTNLDAFPFKAYDGVFYHSAQLGIRVNKNYRFYLGVDNIFDTLPPYGLTGTGAGGAIYPVTGRYLYAGARLTF